MELSKLKSVKAAIISILLSFIILYLYKSPARNPSTPKANICQGVQGPCPKKKFDTSADTAPVKKPASGPKDIPVIITIAATGLNCGNIAKANLPIAAIADITAIGTISLALGFLLSNKEKNNHIAKIIKYMLTNQ